MEGGFLDASTLLLKHSFDLQRPGAGSLFALRFGHGVQGTLSPRLSAPAPPLPLRLVWQEEAIRSPSAGPSRGPRARSPSPGDRDCICLVLPSDALALRTKVRDGQREPASQRLRLWPLALCTTGD